MDEELVKEETKAEIAIIDEHTIRDKIYEVRGVKVMLDFELAEIYGYTTKRFNEQVKNNIEKFDEDFRFQITREELEELVRSKKSTSRDDTLFKGQSGGTRYLPWCFTESGVYMLMTVLRGKLATQQSKALIRIFRAMKEYIVETQGLVTQRDILRFSIQTEKNTDAIRNMNSAIADQQKLINNQQIALQEQQNLLLKHDDKLVNAFERINEMVKRSEISAVFNQFEDQGGGKEYLLREGHPVKADVTYMDIYSKAAKSLYLIDNYINIKTLRLLQSVKIGVDVTVFSDNLRNHLHASDYEDFQVEFPSISINFITTGGIIHDRFIVLDYDEDEERIFHCSASSKDAAVKLTTAITEMTSEDIKTHMHDLIEKMKKNPLLNLR